MSIKPSYFISPHIMQVFSASCMAECKYCFGPHKGKVADLKVINSSINFLENAFTETKQKKASIIFHGGEPLTLPKNLWQLYFENLHHKNMDVKINYSLQSNLWMLDEDFCNLFQKYNVSIGTSLDGPEELNDRQRGNGYFTRTTNGIKLAESMGLDVGCIATFTPLNVECYSVILEFFIKEKLSLSIHPSLKPLNHTGNNYLFLNAEQFTTLELKLLDAYIKNRKRIRIGSFDRYIQSVTSGTGQVCTFQDCFGKFIAIAPDGGIYSCQRLIGNKEFCLGNVVDKPTLIDLENHPNAKKIIDRQNEVTKRCSDCEHYSYCKGGCYYNAISNGDGIIDHYCETYKTIFNEIKKRLIKEISNESNINAMKENLLEKDDEHLFLKKGKLISLTKDVHPYNIAQNAKFAIALHEIAKGPNLSAAAQRMFEDGITDVQEYTFNALKLISNNMLRNRNEHSLNNLYLHVTFQCNLQCTHCYANAAISKNSTFININSFESIIQEARGNHFRQTVITGGEPLIHPQIDEILLHLKSVKSDAMNLVLRTNFTGKYSDDFLLLVAESFHQVVVSVDGNKDTHDSRRGQGTYDIMNANISRYQKLIRNKKDAFAELSLACVMSAADINGDPGDSVRKLADELNIKRVRFRPLLPLGRAKEWELPPTSEAIGAHIKPMEFIKNSIRPNLSCGLGQNLYVEPNGDAFPCYAYHKPHSILGNIIKEGLSEVLSSTGFKSLSNFDVDHIEKCKTCEYRYLCGGACRAWSGEAAQYKLDAPPLECDGLKERAKNIVDAARRYLIDDEL